MNQRTPNKTLTKKKLGRGLSSLFQETSLLASSPEALDNTRPSRTDSSPSVFFSSHDTGSFPPQEGPLLVDVQAIETGHYQPRHHFHKENLEELCASIKEKGIFQPLLLCPHPHNFQKYQLIAGERRLRAAVSLGLPSVPCHIVRCTPQEALEISLLENIQRDNLRPLEEAKGYERLMKEFSHTQEIIAQKIGKSRSHIANILRLLHLPTDVQRLLEEEKITFGHARALVHHPQALDLARLVVSKNLSVRQVEEIVSRETCQKSSPPPSFDRQEKGFSEEAQSLSCHLSQMVGEKTKASFKENGKCSVKFMFKTPMDLDFFIKNLETSYRRAVQKAF